MSIYYIILMIFFVLNLLNKKGAETIIIHGSITLER